MSLLAIGAAARAGALIDGAVGVDGASTPPGPVIWVNPDIAIGIATGASEPPLSAVAASPPAASAGPSAFISGDIIP